MNHVCSKMDIQQYHLIHATSKYLSFKQVKECNQQETNMTV